MLNADHKARLRRSLVTFLEEDARQTRDLRHVATVLDVIPIMDDRDRELGIRLSDGKVVSFSRQEPFDLKVVALPNAELAVLGHAWTMFPELAPLVPVRPANAINCPACDGSGSIKHGERPSGFSCYCGGLGWLFRDGWVSTT